MRAVIQRVHKSRVLVNGEVVGEIGKGLNVLLAVSLEDEEKDVEWLAEKTVHLRIFPDEQGKMNRSLLDVNGEILVVSQFTLYGDCTKGRRPSFLRSAPAEKGKYFYERYVQALRRYTSQVATGIFGAMMDVEIVNWGPVTLILDTPFAEKKHKESEA